MSDGKSPMNENCPICELGERLFRYHDTGTLFSDVLRTAMSVSGAVAGTIYIRKKSRLFFVWSENMEKESWSALYPTARLAVDRSSLAGYVSETGEALVVPDVRDIEGKPYIFNPEFDKKSGFMTRGAAMFPLFGERSTVSGVMQILNGGFTPEIVEHLSRIAALAGRELRRVDRARRGSLRMLRMAALKDPLETAEHVQRVGYLSAEIMTAHGERTGLGRQTIIENRDNIFFASMLHDVGKVGIPDLILKKPGRLTDDERLVMEEHVLYGAELFNDESEEFVDNMSRNIILHHHQRYDGQGYPRNGQLGGEDIPLEARIVSIADVYDALVSKRCYKEAMPEEKALSILMEGRGTQFDPLLLDIFMEIQPSMREHIESYGREYFSMGGN